MSADIGLILSATDRASPVFRSVADQARSFGESLGGIGKLAAVGMAGAATAVVGIGAGIGAAALGVAGDYASATATIQAQTGLQGDALKDVSDVAKRVYENAFGESAASVAADVAKIRSAFGDLGGEELQGLTEDALRFKNVFGAEVADSVRAGSVLTKQFGIDQRDAFDLMTTAIQKTGDPAGDLLDTFHEYSNQFQQLGFDAQDMTGILINGLQGGAFNADKVGDAVKEFGIRIKDGSSTSTDALKALGINWDKLQKGFKDGSVTGKDAMLQVIDSLKKIEDPVKRNIQGVALFGTQWEDVGEKAILAMADGMGGLDDFRGATERAGNALDDNFGTKWTAFTRQLTGTLAPIGAGLMSLANDALTAATPIIQEITAIAKALPAAFSGEESFGAIFGPFGDVLDEIRAKVVALVAVFRGEESLGAAIGPIGDTIENLVTQVSGAFNALSHIFAGGDAEGGFLQLATILRDAFGPEVEGIVIGFVQNVKGALDSFMAFAGQVAAAFQEGGLHGAIQAVFGPEMAVYVSAFVESVSGFLSTLWTVISTQLVPALREFAEWAGPHLGPVLQTLGQIVGVVLVASFTAIGVALMTATEIIGRTGEAFSTLGSLGDLLRIAIGKAADGIGEKFREFGSNANSLKETVGGRFSELGTAADNLRTGVGGAFDALGTKAGEMRDAVGSAIGAAVKAITDAIGSAGTEAGRLGQAIVDGLVNTISNGIGAVGRAARDLAQGAMDALKAVIQPGSPSKVAMEYARSIVDAFPVVFAKGERLIEAATHDLMAAYLDAVREDGDVLNDWLANLPHELQAQAFGAGLDIMRELGEGLSDPHGSIAAMARDLGVDYARAFWDGTEEGWQRFRKTLPELVNLTPSFGLTDPSITGRAGGGYNPTPVASDPWDSIRGSAGGGYNPRPAVVVHGNVYAGQGLGDLVTRTAQATITQRTDRAVIGARGIDFL